MPEKRRKTSPQFKGEAVQLVVSTGRPVAEVARELEINGNNWGNRVQPWQRDNPESEAEMSAVERARLSELEAEVRRCAWKASTDEWGLVGRWFAGWRERF